MKVDRVMEVPELHEVIVHKEVLVPVVEQVVKEAVCA